MKDDKFLIKLGKNILKIRKSKNWTQKELAKKLKIQRSSMTRIEKGGANCTINLLRKIASKLEVPVEELIKVS